MFCKKITINWQNSKLIILIYFHCKTLSESINLLISKMVHEELRGLLVELPLLHRVLPLLPQHLLPEVHPLCRQVLHHLGLGLDVHVVLKMVNIHEKEQYRKRIRSILGHLGIRSDGVPQRACLVPADG